MLYFVWFFTISITYMQDYNNLFMYVYTHMFAPVNIFFFQNHLVGGFMVP